MNETKIWDNKNELLYPKNYCDDTVVSDAAGFILNEIGNDTFLSKISSACTIQSYIGTSDSNDMKGSGA